MPKSETIKVSMLTKIRTHKGQNLIEYALIASVVSAVLIGMSTYVFRSVQATQQTIQSEGNE